MLRDRNKGIHVYYKCVVIFFFFSCAIFVFCLLLALWGNQWADSSHTRSATRDDKVIRTFKCEQYFSLEWQSHCTYVCIEHRRYNLSCDSLNSNEPENTYTRTLPFVGFQPSLMPKFAGTPFSQSFESKFRPKPCVGQASRPKVE